MKFIDKSKISVTNILFLFSFIEGGITMTVELVFANIISTYFGGSIQVWSVILIASMIGLSFGYFVGGIWSQKATVLTYSYVLFFSILYVCFSLLFLPQIVDFSIDYNFMIGVSVLASILIGIPLFILGSTVPMVIQILSNKAKENASKIVGQVYFWSTVGGIIFSLVMTMVFVPVIGNVNTILLGLLLLFVALTLLSVFQTKKTTLILVMIMLFLVVFKFQSPVVNYDKLANVIYSSDGLLGEIIVYDSPDGADRSLVVNNTIQTYVHIPTGKSKFKYPNRLGLYTSYFPAESHVLLIGLAGGSLVREFTYLEYNIDIVEIDARMETVARDYFGSITNSNATIYIDDARHYLNTCKKQYDIIVLDVSSGETQPSNLYTTGGFKNIYDLLKEDGALFIHYPNFLVGEASIAIKSIGKTLEQTGFYCSLINTGYVNNSYSERIFYATKMVSPLGEQHFIRRDRFVDRFQFPMQLEAVLKDYSFEEGIILTDDKPIMDILHNHTLAATRIRLMKNNLTRLVNQ